MNNAKAHQRGLFEIIAFQKPMVSERPETLKLIFLFVWPKAKFKIVEFVFASTAVVGVFVFNKFRIRFIKYYYTI
jgi:hypothetical protein